MVRWHDGCLWLSPPFPYLKPRSFSFFAELCVCLFKYEPAINSIQQGKPLTLLWTAVKCFSSAVVSSALSSTPLSKPKYLIVVPSTSFFVALFVSASALSCSFYSVVYATMCFPTTSMPVIIVSTHFSSSTCQIQSYRSSSALIHTSLQFFFSLLSFHLTLHLISLDYSIISSTSHPFPSSAFFVSNQVQLPPSSFSFLSFPFPICLNQTKPNSNSNSNQT